MRNFRLIDVGPVCVTQGDTRAESGKTGVSGERQKGDIGVIFCKGVARDNRLSSEYRTQKGLKLIAGCDKV